MRLSEEKHAELMGLVAATIKVTKPTGCRSIRGIKGRFSRNAKGYVQVKVKTPNLATDTTPPNEKVQLHQLLAWNHPAAAMRASMRAAIAGSKDDSGATMEISHLCDMKDCSTTDHLCAESSIKNKTRWGCPAVIFINEVMHSCCKCTPMCVPNEDEIRTALRYTVA